jgi:hypothetical protein
VAEWQLLPDPTALGSMSWRNLGPHPRTATRNPEPGLHLRPHSTDIASSHHSRSDSLISFLLDQSSINPPTDSHRSSTRFTSPGPPHHDASEHFASSSSSPHGFDLLSPTDLHTLMALVHLRCGGLPCYYERIASRFSWYG